MSIQDRIARRFTAAMAPRPSCMLCVKKHIAQAAVLFQEALQGYPGHRWLAIGHLAEAEAEIQEADEDYADEIRKQRKLAEEGDYIPDCIALLYRMQEVDGSEMYMVASRVASKFVAKELNHVQTEALGKVTKKYNDKYGYGKKNPEANALAWKSGLKLFIRYKYDMTFADLVRGLGEDLETFERIPKISELKKVGLKVPNMKAIAEKALKLLSGYTDEFEFKLKSVDKPEVSDTDSWNYKKWDKEPVYVWAYADVKTTPLGAVKEMKPPRPKYRKNQFVILDKDKLRFDDMRNCTSSGCYAKIIKVKEASHPSDENPYWDYEVEFVNEEGDFRGKPWTSLEEHVIIGTFRPKKKPDKSAILNDVQKFIKGLSTWFEEDDKGRNSISYSSREYGDGGSERAGREDIQEAKRLISELKQKFGKQVRVDAEVVDEWVTVSVSV